MMQNESQEQILANNIQKEELAQRQFGETAQAYATSVVHAQGPDLQQIVKIANLDKTQVVADVATGAGHTAIHLAPHAETVFAIDLAQPMLQAAKQLATERGITNIRFLEGPAQALPLATNSIDVVTCRYAAHHFSDVVQAVREWVRVLKPGGKVIVSDTIAPEEPEFDQFINHLDFLRDSSHIRSYRVSEWLSILQEAGLTANVVYQGHVYIDGPSWVKRIRTPLEQIKEIKILLAEAAPVIRERFQIKINDTEFGFNLPKGIFVGIKPLEANDPEIENIQAAAYK